MDMSAAEVYAFIAGKTVYVFDPNTRNLVATILYGFDGSCDVKFATGETDVGEYGFDENYYWTRYARFREGLKNSFLLQRRDDYSAQAYHKNGDRAFLLSHQLCEDGACELK